MRTLTENKKRAPATLILRTCVGCGVCVETRSRKLEYCADCARKRKACVDAAYKASKRPEHKVYVCKDCGKSCEYDGRLPKRYCPECKSAATKAATAKHDAKRRRRSVVGSVYSCRECGVSFERRGTNHHLCDACAPVVAKARIAKHASENRESRRASSKRYNDKRRSTPQGHLEWTMRVAVRRAVSGDELAGKRTFAVLGYAVDDLKNHLERQFKDGMTWENYGDWHIDHIIPLAAHTYETTDCPEFKRAWALTNLQPLWAAENMSKGAKIIQLM